MATNTPNEFDSQARFEQLWQRFHPDSENNQPRQWFVAVRRLIIASGLPFCGATALGLLGKWWWFADLAREFRVQYVVFLLPVVLLALLVRVWKSAAIFIVVLLLNLWPIASYAAASNSTPSAEINGSDVTQMRLLTQNVLTSNQNYFDLVELVEREQPDFVVLLEINRDWIEGISELEDDYPHFKVEYYSGNFGIAMLSKHKWAENQVMYSSTGGLPSLSARFDFDSGPFDLIATHPFPPIGSRRANARNTQLFDIASSLDADTPRIFTGDFNMTPWSSQFEEILDKGQLRDGSRGFKTTPTWHTFPTMVGGLKIDHALLSETVGVSDFRVGPDIGSDHRSIIVDFTLPT